MKNHEDIDFVFGSDDENHLIRNDADNERLDSLSHRITLISVILPCIIGIILVFGYFDIKSRVARVSHSGTQEVKNVSMDMERMISQLQVRNAKLEKLLGEKVSEIDRSISSLEKKLRKSEKNIDFLTVSRISKKEVNPKIKGLKSSLTSLRKELKSLSSETETLKNGTGKLGRQIDAADSQLIGILEELKQLEQLRNEINDIIVSSKGRLEQNDLDLALKKERIIYKVKIDQVREELKREIDLLKFAGTKKKAKGNKNPSQPLSSEIIEQDLTH